MFSYVKEFITRHKKKMIFVGVVIGGAILGSRYAQRRFIEWQEKETKEFLERTRKQHYFESSEKTCNQTILVLSSTLRENVVNFVNCERIIQQLRENPVNKIELWQELKVLVFTKVSLLVYSGTLLVIALRIQLNIIGGHIYCNTLEPESETKVSSDVQEKYLSKCHYFLDEGVKELYPLVLDKVQLALKDVTLKQTVTLQQIENMFWAIQSSISSDSLNPINNIPRLLYGSKCVDEEDTFIKEMMLDTFDLLQSSEVTNLASSCISRGFSNLIDKVSEFFLPPENCSSLCEFPSTSREEDRIIKFAHPNSLSKPFAKIIPIINGYGIPGSSDLPDTWISPFIYMESVKALGANIYESYSIPKL